MLWVLKTVHTYDLAAEFLGCVAQIQQNFSQYIC